MKRTESTLLATNTDFTQGSTMRHVTVMSLTSSVGIMAIYLVDLLDIFFVSLLGQQEVAAAAGFASTVMFYVSAVSIGVSVAAGSLVAQHLGRGEVEISRDVAAAATVTGFMIGTAMPAAMLPFAPALVGFLGAEGKVAELAVMYLWIVLPASFLSAMSMALVAALRAHGMARWAMYPALAGAGVNLIFDPILIFDWGLDLGLAGAAWATVMARTATFAIAFYGCTRVVQVVSRPTFRGFKTYIKSILDYAWPAVMSSLAAPIGLSIIMRFMTAYGTDAVAGMAIVGRISPVVFSVVNALSSAIGPIIGQNFGARKWDRVERSYNDALKFLANYTLLAVAVLAFFRTEIADMFQAEGDTRRLLYFYCGPYALSAFFNGWLIVTSAAFINMGRPVWATRINWAKSTVGLFVSGYVGSALFGFYGLAMGVLLNAALFAYLSHVLTKRIMKEAPTLYTEEVDIEFEGAARLKEAELREPIHT